jgi:hypothetical protein
MDHHVAWRMHPDLFSLYIPLAITVVPWLVVRFTGYWNYHAKGFPYWPHAWLLWLGGLGWALGIQLWNIPVSPSTESTTMHLLGGAIVVPALYHYALRAYGLKESGKAPIRLLLLLTAVTVFGLVFEMAELVMNIAGSHINTSDTWWDLAANTVGTLLAFGAIEVVREFRATGRSSVPVSSVNGSKPPA